MELVNKNVFNTESFAILQRIFKYSKKWKNIPKNRLNQGLMV